MVTLTPLFRPRGIAIAGASNDPAKVGHQILHNLLEAGYPGQIAIVHPRAQSVLGVHAHPDLMSVPSTVELLILAVPATTTLEMVEAIRRRKQERGDLQVVVAIAGGFAEARTEEGQTHQDLLAETCRQIGVRLVGPNCLGVRDHRNRIDTTFLVETHRRVSGISLLSQSGAMGAWMAMEWSARPVPMGMNKFISLGNAADLSMPEVLEYLAKDPTTRAIGLYLERVPSARRLLEAAGRAALSKPVVVMKAGRTEPGAGAARSHTGAAQGADPIYDGALRQYGLLRVKRVDDFAATLAAFDRLPLPLGNRVAVLSNAGGPGVYTLDALANEGITFAQFSPATTTALRATLPPFAEIGRPTGYVDMTGGVTPRQVAQAVASALRDPGVDAVLHLYVPTKFNSAEEMAQELLRLLPGLRRNSLDKPLFLVPLFGNAVATARQMLEQNGMITFDSPNQAAVTLSAMVRYAVARQSPPSHSRAAKHFHQSRSDAVK